MKIPVKIRLNGIDYDVVWVDNLNDGCSILDGQIDHNASVIRLNSSTQGYQQQCVTFLHEVCHAFLQLHDFANVGTDARIPKDEETLVELFARSIYQFLQDNGRALFDLRDKEEPSARWEWYEEPITSLRPDPDYGWRCSHCKEDAAAIIQRASPTSNVEFDNPDVPPKFDYCPNCGARMSAREEATHG